MQSTCNRIHQYFYNYIPFHCSLGDIIELIDNFVSIELKSNSSIYCRFYEIVRYRLVFDYGQYSIKSVIAIKN